MWDTSVEHHALWMMLPSLDEVPSHPLPSGYSWRFFEPGDELRWAEIETSAGEFATPQDGLARFRRDYPTNDELDERLIFLTLDEKPVATITAWHVDTPTDGKIQWVSVDAAYQGRGLSKPLVSLALQRLRELGHTAACLHTQTESWVAVGVYASFGFRPLLGMPNSAGEEEGWRIVREKLGYLPDPLQY